MHERSDHFTVGLCFEGEQNLIVTVCYKNLMYEHENENEKLLDRQALDIEVAIPW